MLTLHESSFLFKHLQFWSKFCIFPLKVSVNSGYLIQFSRWKVVIWRILHLLVLLHCLYGLLDVVCMLHLRRNDVVLYHLPVQFDGTIIPSILYLPVAIAFISNVNTVAKLFNELYRGSTKNSSGRRHWFQLDTTELIAFGGSFVATGYIIFYMAMICIESSMSHLLINSSLLISYRSNIGVVILAYGIELYSLATWVVQVGFMVSMNALVIATVQEDTKDLVTNLRKDQSVEMIKTALKTSRKVQLYLQLFNALNAWFVQAFKTVLMLSAILHGYFGVRFRNNLVVSSFCYCVHAMCIISYCGAFQRAYHLVVGQRNVMSEIVAASRQVRNQNTRRELLREVKSRRRIGIKVGSFHEIERNSSVIFLDFVEKQLIGFLVAF